MKHMRKRTGEKPYQCNQCDNTFSLNCNLIRHLRTHTGKKPYQCNQCDEAFSLNGYLTRHLRTHIGEKLYQCNQCDKASSLNNGLIRHQREHTAVLTLLLSVSFLNMQQFCIFDASIENGFTTYFHMCNNLFNKG
ncbi:unnamed protein product, partial [Meganyctiphanes norvegica]